MVFYGIIFLSFIVEHLANEYDKYVIQCVYGKTNLL